MPAETQLLILRAAHTAVFAVEVAAILYMIWRGLRGPLDRWCLFAVILTAGTGLGLLLNNGDCIFHTWAADVSGDDGVSDLFLPLAAANLIFPVSLPFVTLGYVLLLRRWLLGRKAGRG